MADRLVNPERKKAVEEAARLLVRAFSDCGVSRVVLEIEGPTCQVKLKLETEEGELPAVAS